YPWQEEPNNQTLGTGWLTIETTASWTDSTDTTCSVLTRLGSTDSGDSTCVNSNEVKGAFVSRITADNYNSLLVYNGGEPGNSTYVCFAPLSDAFTVKAENRCLGDAGEYGALSPDFPDEACDGTQKYYCLP
ncbi:MAG: hypothetical protein GW947_04730, partial [Candidatus Pacebacteria bacterium]|nr:hypothetical protein [Candidatus Paceibacterota bacterium]